MHHITGLGACLNLQVCAWTDAGSHIILSFANVLSCGHSASGIHSMVRPSGTGGSIERGGFRRLSYTCGLD